MIADSIICILLVLGVFFALIGVLGILRMPDVFGRLQASTCIATLGTICVIAAGIVYAATREMQAGTYVKLALILLLVLGTNPISNHALLKGACRRGVKPERELVVDDYKEDDPE